MIVCVRESKLGWIDQVISMHAMNAIPVINIDLVPAGDPPCYSTRWNGWVARLAQESEGLWRRAKENESKLATVTPPPTPHPLSFSLFKVKSLFSFEFSARVSFARRRKSLWITRPVWGKRRGSVEARKDEGGMIEGKEIIGRLRLRKWLNHGSIFRCVSYRSITSSPSSSSSFFLEMEENREDDLFFVLWIG